MKKLSGTTHPLPGEQAGRLLIMDASGEVIFQNFPVDVPVPVHSAAKPIQSLPFFLLHLDEVYDLSDREKAILSSSHLGQSQHMEVLSALLEKTGIREDELLLPKMPPAGHLAKENWRRANLPSRKLYHPCAGNHVALLLAQRELTGQAAGYADPSSRVQQEVRRLMAAFAECDADTIGTMTDGCGIPGFRLTLRELANVYRHLACGASSFSDAGISPAVVRNIAAMKKQPLMLEGDGCLSSIVSAAPGLLGKTGMNYLFAVGHIQQHYSIVVQSVDRQWSSVAALLEEGLLRMMYSNSEVLTQIQALSQ